MRPPLSALASRLMGRQGTGPAPTCSAWKKLENWGCPNPSPIALADFGRWGQSKESRGEKRRRLCPGTGRGARLARSPPFLRAPEGEFGRLSSCLPRHLCGWHGAISSSAYSLSLHLCLFQWSILGPGPSPASPLRLQQGSEPGWDFGVKQREPAPHPCTTLLPVQQHLSPIKSPFQHLGTNSLLQHTAAPVPNRSG